MRPMGTGRRSFRLIAMVGMPLLISIVILRLMSNDVLTIMTAWILASFPIGILIGHCVLSEE
jgi:hypothetical protein